MRLCRPGFHQYVPVYSEPDGVLGDLSSVGANGDAGSGDNFGLTRLMQVRGAHLCPCLATQGHGGGGGGVLCPLSGGWCPQLPPNFGNIFMGETFCSYISAFNNSFRDVTNVRCASTAVLPLAALLFGPARRGHVRSVPNTYIT